MRGAAHGRRAVFVPPAAWLVGGLIGLAATPTVTPIFTTFLFLLFEAGGRGCQTLAISTEGCPSALKDAGAGRMRKSWLMSLRLPPQRAKLYSVSSLAGGALAPSFCGRRLPLYAHFPVCGFRFSLLLRIRRTCLIIAVFEDNHLNPLTLVLPVNGRIQARWLPTARYCH